MRLVQLITISLALLFAGSTAAELPRPVWPPAPDQPRVEYLGEIQCRDLKRQTGFFGKIKRLIGGGLPDERLSYPFDVLLSGGALFLTCQNLPALVKVDIDQKTYRVYDSGSLPLNYPVALCAAGELVFLTDSENAAVYRLAEDKLQPLITTGLIRPTGIAAVEDKQRLYVVDTGDHTIKIFDFTGKFIRTIGDHADSTVGLNYPTFAVSTADGTILINDALNYRIKRFDGEGKLLTVFGREGDGPGAFARAKGLAVDSQDHIYVVDNLFDNIQVFDQQGRVLLVVGGAGQQPGQFWSPGGIDIVNDTIYVADTFNNRVQILHYLGGGR